MAEVDTSVYKNLQPQDPLKQPLAIMQLLNSANQNRLFEQTYNARQNIGDAYKKNVDPNGLINHRGAAADIARTGGFLAPEGVGSAIANSTNQFSLDASKLKQAQQSISALAADPNVKRSDFSKWATQMVRNGVDPEIIHSVLDSVYSAPDQKSMRKAAMNQGFMSIGTGAMEGEAGPVDEQNRPTQITKAEAAQRRAGVFPDQKRQTGMVTTNPLGLEEAAKIVGGQSASMANSLTSANDTSMQRKGMLGNLEEDLTKFTAGPAADWTKVAKAWYNRNVPKPKGWDFDPASIASQEQFVKQSNMLANAQFQALGGTGTDNQFNATFHTSPNELLSEMGNKGIIRLLKGNEDAIQAKNKAWRQWVAGGNGPQTYPQFSEQFNDHFDPRSFQFKYIPQEERQSYIDKMVPEERQRFLRDLTFARKQGWINFEQPKR